MPIKKNPRLNLVLDALDRLKAKQVTTLDVTSLTQVTDWMVIASGTSSRHLKALAEQVVEQAKASGERPLSVEGEQGGEWVLVDLGDVLVHLMLPHIREYYDLERLWNPAAPQETKN